MVIPSQPTNLRLVLVFVAVDALRTARMPRGCKVPEDVAEEKVVY